jgi:hypothetical protein
MAFAFGATTPVVTDENNYMRLKIVQKNQRS